MALRINHSAFPHAPTLNGKRTHLKLWGKSTLFPQCSQIFEREDGQFQIGHADDAPCFPTRAFALRVAAGHPPVPAQSAPKFRRINIREVRHVATA